jgi:hypothetical protein
MNVSGIELDIDRNRLNPRERAFLDRCATSDVGEICVSIKLLPERHAWARDERFVIMGSLVESEGSILRVGNCVFSAELDLVRRTATLHREESGDGSLRLTLRAIATSFLPTTGWLPLHAAAVDTDGSALVFCGRSGAGKSTLAATSPWPLLSDEMVSVSTRPARARGTSFWGDSVCKAPLGRTALPLRAIVILEKARGFRLERAASTEAARALVATTLTPAVPTLWPIVLGSIGRLVEEVDVFRMAWWKDDAPWDPLAIAGLCGSSWSGFSPVEELVADGSRGWRESR